MARGKRSGRTAKPSIRERAYRHIQRLVTDGTLEAGASISELVLADQLGSSRTPIREAMNQLAAEGLLEVSPNGGMVVAQLKREDIIELYELREALEVYAVGKVARIPLRPADKDRLQYTVDLIAALENEVEKDGVRELDSEQMTRFIACDLRFHALLMSMTNNSRIQKIIHETRLLIRIFAIQRRGHTAQELRAIRDYHQRILDAVAGHDPVTAMQMLAEHIQISQRERLNQYDDWRREFRLQKDMSTVFNVGSLEPVL